MARTKATARSLAARAEVAAAAAAGKSRPPAAKMPKASADAPKAAIAKTGEPRKHRWRPGTKALRDIKRQQLSEDRAIPKAVIIRLCREIAQEIGEKIRFTRGAFAGMHEMCEIITAEMMNDATNFMAHANRKTLLAVDFELAKHYANLRNPHPSMKFEVDMRIPALSVAQFAQTEPRKSAKRDSAGQTEPAAASTSGLEDLAGIQIGVEGSD